MSLFSRLVVGSAESAPIKKLVTSTSLGQRVARRFVAGETLDEAIVAARKLNKAGMSVSLDLLGEEVAAPEEVDQARREYEACLHRIAEEGIDANISVKLTQLGLSLDEELTANTLDQLAKEAAALELTITIDMEDSTYTASTIEIYRAAQARHGNLGVALQAYLYRTPDDLALLAPHGGHVRLCKGAYVEPKEIAYTDKDDVDAAYVRLLEQLMGEPRTIPAIATHDPRLVEVTRRLARARSAPFEFQMLYGIAMPMQRELAGAGYSMRIYVPYGVRWYPYLVRRLGERPANLLFFLRAVVGRS
jgi:proline dehydrogenase